MSLPEDSWRVRPNDMFAREGRCLLFASLSPSLRDCRACRTVAWCEFYDREGVRRHDRLSLATWDDDGGRPPRHGHLKSC